MANTTYQLLEPGAKELLYARKYVWQLPIRLCHWVNVLAITTLFATGLYISSPILAPNGEAWQHFVMGRVRQIHFISGYVLLFSFLVRIYRSEERRVGKDSR